MLATPGCVCRAFAPVAAAAKPRPIAPATAARPAIRIADISDLNFHDAGHPPGPDEDAAEREREHCDTQRLGVERPQVLRSHECQRSGDEDRQADEDIRRQSSLSAQRANLAL